MKIKSIREEPARIQTGKFKSGIKKSDEQINWHDPGISFCTQLDEKRRNSHVKLVSVCYYMRALLGRVMAIRHIGRANQLETLGYTWFAAMLDLLDWASWRRRLNAELNVAPAAGTVRAPIDMQNVLCDVAQDAHRLHSGWSTRLTRRGGRPASLPGWMRRRCEACFHVFP